MKDQTTTSTQASGRPSWGPAWGLLTGCGITLVGVSLNLQPETILIRSIIGGSLVALLAAVLSLGWQLVAHETDDD